jgi:AraC-like DNA-binding protein
MPLRAAGAPGVEDIDGPMAPATSDFTSVRFSSSDLVERDRIPHWREVMGRSVLRIDIEPLPDVAFHADIALRAMPGLTFAQAAMWGARETRTRELLSDGNDSVALVLNLSGPFIASQRDRDIVLGDGDAFLLSFAEVGSFIRPVPGKSIGIALPFSALAPLVPNFEDTLMRPIPHDTEAMRLLTGYVGLLQNGRALENPELRRLAVVHFHDLLALALGATRDAAALAEGRGGRAARLRAIKVDIVENLGRSDLTIDALSRRHRLDVRYIQRLFERDGTTYSQFVLGQRLTRAHRMLGDPQLSGATIGDVASACGFGEQGYFSRCFRAVYGASPSDIKAAAQASR